MLQPVLKEKLRPMKMNTAAFDSLIDKSNYNLDESQTQTSIWKDALDRSVVASLVEGADGKVHRMLSIDVTPR